MHNGYCYCVTGCLLIQFQYSAHSLDGVLKGIEQIQYCAHSQYGVLDVILFMFGDVSLGSSYVCLLLLPRKSLLPSHDELS